MHLTVRPARVEDLPAIIEMHHEGFSCEPELRQRLPQIWLSWLESGLLHFDVVDDTLQRRSSNPVAFGSAGFVSEEFIAEMSAKPLPHIGADLARLWLDGRNHLLDYDAVRQRNSSSGLHLVVPYFGMAAERFGPDAFCAVLRKLVDGFLLAFRGYRLNGCHIVGYGHSEIGAGIIQDYRDYFDRYPHERPPQSLHPLLVTLRRDLVPIGNSYSAIFDYRPPIMLFKPLEQRILSLSLMDLSDEEIAVTLHISLATVRKRWRSIFAAAGQQRPEVIPDARLHAAKAGSRGVEKRSALLRYLRNHPEELRPVDVRLLEAPHSNRANEGA